MSKKQIIESILRHTITLVGGIIITKGIIEESVFQEIVGGTTALVGFILSLTKKEN